MRMVVWLLLNPEVLGLNFGRSCFTRLARKCFRIGEMMINNLAICPIPTLHQYLLTMQQDEDCPTG